MMATADNNNAGSLDAEALASDMNRASLEEAQGQATESDGAGTEAVAQSEETEPEDGDDLYYIDECDDEEAFRQHVHACGVDRISKVIANKLEKFKHQKIKLAVTGARGSGKSSLINTLRGLRPKQKGAAQVGITETTTEIEFYAHPELPNYMLYDLPGISPSFPRASYISDVNLVEYHCLIICSESSFTEDDLWLANESHKCKIPFVFLRTHIDSDIEKSRYDHGEEFVEEECLQSIRAEIQGHLSRKNIPCNGAVFLISTRLDKTMKWEYSKLLLYVKNSLPKKLCDAYVMTMASVTTDVINAKKEILKNRINKVAFMAAMYSSIGFNGERVIEAEYKLYKQVLGLPIYYMPLNLATPRAVVVAGGGLLTAFAASEIGVIAPLLVGAVFSVSLWKSRKHYKEMLSNRLNELTESAMIVVECGSVIST